MEIWKDIEGYEGYYQISSIGRVKSLRQFVNHRKGIVKNREIIRAPRYNRGYACVSLKCKNKPDLKFFLVHILVAKAFIPNPNNKPFINHVNAIRNDNRVENLEWCTNGENIRHAVSLGLINYIGRKGVRGALTEAQVLEIIELSKTFTAMDLARKYKVNDKTIRNIKKGRAWKRLTITA